MFFWGAQFGRAVDAEVVFAPACGFGRVLGLRACWASRGCVAPVVALANELLEKRESLYNNIFIFGDKDNVTMTFGQNKRYYTESSMKLSDPGALSVEYTRYMTVGIAYPPKLERIAEIGLGGGRTVSYLSASLPDTGILAIELDKDVVDLAKKYFKFQETAKLRAVVSDGRAFLLQGQREVGRHPDRRLSRAVRAVSSPDPGVLHAGEVAAQSRRRGGAEHRALDHAVRFAPRRRSRACFPRSISTTAAATWSRSAMTGRSCRKPNCWRAPPRSRSATSCATT